MLIWSLLLTGQTPLKWTDTNTSQQPPGDHVLSHPRHLVGSNHRNLHGWPRYFLAELKEPESDLVLARL